MSANRTQSYYYITALQLFLYNTRRRAAENHELPPLEQKHKGTYNLYITSVADRNSFPAKFDI